MVMTEDAMNTGLTMTTTTLAALIALFIVSSGTVMTFIRIDIIRDISVVLIFGLFADIVNTWMTNVGILRWYIEKGAVKEKRSEKPAKRVLLRTHTTVLSARTLFGLKNEQIPGKFFTVYPNLPKDLFIVESSYPIDVENSSKDILSL